MGLPWLNVACDPVFVPQHRGPEKTASHHSKIDADIDSLTSMLADLDSRPHDASTQVRHAPLQTYGGPATV